MANDVAISPLQEASDPVSDDRVVSRLRMLCRSSKRTEVEIIRLLVILQARHLDLNWTYSSLYEFCSERLGMTAGEATRRVAAARLIRKVPALLEYLRAGQLSMTTLLCLRDYLTIENADEVLASVANKSKREVQLVLAGREPNAGHRSRRRRSAGNEPRGNGSPSSSTSEGTAGPYRLELARTGGLHEKIELARRLMAQKGLCDDLDRVVEAAMDALLTQLRASNERPAGRPHQVDSVGEPASDGEALSEPGSESSRSPLTPSRSRSQLTPRRPSGKASRKPARKASVVVRAPAGGPRPNGAASLISEALHRPLTHRPAQRPRDRAPSGPRASAGSGRTRRASGSD